MEHKNGQIDRWAASLWREKDGGTRKQGTLAILVIGPKESDMCYEQE